MKYITTLLITFVITTNLIGQTQRTEADAIKRVDSLYADLINGADFALLAGLHSEDPGSKFFGGKYMDMKTGTFVPEFENAISVLKTNEISKPFKTQYGYHIAELLEKKGDTFTVRHILITFKN